MPLVKSTSKSAFRKNIKAEIKDGTIYPRNPIPGRSAPRRPPSR